MQPGTVLGDGQPALPGSAALRGDKGTQGGATSRARKAGEQFMSVQQLKFGFWWFN